MNRTTLILYGYDYPSKDAKNIGECVCVSKFLSIVSDPDPYNLAGSETLFLSFLIHLTWWFWIMLQEWWRTRTVCEDVRDGRTGKISAIEMLPQPLDFDPVKAWRSWVVFPRLWRLDGKNQVFIWGENPGRKGGMFGRLMSSSYIYGPHRFPPYVGQTFLGFRLWFWSNML